MRRESADPGVGGPAGGEEVAKRRTEAIRPVGPTPGVGGPAGDEEVAKRRTEAIRPVGPTPKDELKCFVM